MNSINKYILRIIKENKKEVIIISIIATIGSLLSVAIPYIYGRLFDLAVIPNTSLNLLLSLIFVWLVVNLVSNYTQNKAIYRGNVLGAKVAWSEEAKSYGHFLSLPIIFHKNKKTGEILNKLSRGAWYMQSLISNFSNLFPQIIILVLSLIVMFLVRWQLAIILAVLFFVYVLITIKYSQTIVDTEDKFLQMADKQYGKVFDKLYNPLLVKNFAMEEKEKENISNQFAKILPTIENSLAAYGKVSLYQGIVYGLSFIIILSSAIFFLRRGSITDGEFIMFFGYINLVFSPLYMLTEFYKAFKKGSAAMRRIIKFRAMIPETMKHGNKILKNVKGEIEFSNVKFEYIKGKTILNGISIKIKPGENLALVGESGVGKSTFSELVLGYYKPIRGNIFLDGVNMSELKLQWLREQMAIVPQELSVLNDTIINNIKYANQNASYDEIVNAAKAAGAHDFIIKLQKKYNTLVGERGVKLSMGQKQRLALTMAFLKNPKVLILDEPTSALDADSERVVQRGIKDLIKGRTTVIIAHRFSTVREADKIIVLDKGRIVEEGNHQQLMKKKGRYYHLYNLQTGLN